MATMPTFGRRRSQTTIRQNNNCVAQPRKQAEQECLKYLQDTLMPFDVPFFETLGFSNRNRNRNHNRNHKDDEVDGLGNGIVTVSVKLALDAKATYEWTDSLDKEIFYNYVVNYANLNEARTNWRPLLIDAMNFTESSLWKSGNANLSSVVTWVNTHLWTQLSRNGDDKPIYFKSGQTPLIFDPMSVIANGYASCTGTSILFSNALRALGIPSRVAGTPAWYGNASQGNHNWVEVYDHGVWKFLEPSPALANVDSLEADPCSRWFCNKERYPSSKVYAATLSKVVSSYFPLAWESNCKDIPALDRTQYYVDVCSICD